jgi:hypothetical protein
MASATTTSYILNRLLCDSDRSKLILLFQYLKLLLAALLHQPRYKGLPSSLPLRFSALSSFQPPHVLAFGPSSMYSRNAMCNVQRGCVRAKCVMGGMAITAELPLGDDSPYF